MKSTATTFGIRCRTAMHASIRLVNVVSELTVPASTGSGGPLGRSQWLRMKKSLPVPPRLGLQLKSLMELNVNGVSSDTV